MKRTEIRRTPMRSRYRNTGPTPEVVAAVLERDGHRCVVHGCDIRGTRGWDWSIQHRLRRGAGSTRRPWVNLTGNLITLCGSATTGCHGLVEHEPSWAEKNGWRVCDGITLPADTPMWHSRHGRVLLADDGTWTSAPDSLPERAS